jgi:peptidoglycan/xylan/chitin deacetylase (PgdA/CDA1 family)
MTATWDELDRELDAWADAGRVATVWVRDDDAVAATPALDRLLDACARHDLPIALAVIPHGADETLGATVAGRRGVHVLQHGWRHENHAGPGEKKMELGDHRGLEPVREDLAAGRRRLQHLFGARFLPVVAPPWNRIGAEVAASLHAWGYQGLSLFTPRDRTIAAPGLIRVNTHVDIIDWKGTRGFRGDAAAVAQAVAHLKARRLAEVDADEPTGLITHHLVHDAGCRAFIDCFLERLARHPAVRWPAADEIFC